MRRIRLNPPWILNRDGMLDGIVDMPELAAGTIGAVKVLMESLAELSFIVLGDVRFGD